MFCSDSAVGSCMTTMAATHEDCVFNERRVLGFVERFERGADRSHILEVRMVHYEVLKGVRGDCLMEAGLLRQCEVVELPTPAVEALRS